MKLVKAFAIFIVALGVLAILVWQFWFKNQFEFGEVGAAYGAKMVCSCRFVAEREMDSCLRDFTTDMSAIRFSEDGKTIEARAAGGIISAKAVFEPGLGCTLIADD
ncbi:MAG: hypothetical protein WA989_08110 [Henriciella sp.]|uniref:hypothetical protein n=1 Tax=Henriciella sp. TaxID=1968823 RepID=UPI003C77FA7F